MSKVFVVGNKAASGKGAVPALEVNQVQKVFGSKDAVTRALDGVSLEVQKGEFVAVMGPSGSGKSTLLNCISTIEPVTAGSILVDGQDITGLRGNQLSNFRRDKLGFIFQDSNLLDTLTGFENIALALTIKGVPPREVDEAVRRMADSLGVSSVLDKFPGQMSGGQRQRVAAARAMIAGPMLVLADEPTGALDSRNAAVMMDTLASMNRTMGATIVMVTHDAYAASFTQRVLFIKDGRLFTEVVRGDAADRGPGTVAREDGFGAQALPASAQGPDGAAQETAAAAAKKITESEALIRKDFYNRIMEVQAYLGGDQNAC